MTYQVIIEAPAQADLEEVYRRLAADSPEQAAQWYNGLVEAITSLATLPQRCAFAPENAFFAEEIRHLVYGKRGSRYRILFTITANTVHVLHVRHGARQPLRPEKLIVRKLH